MNRLHGVICSSGAWRRSVERELLPWGVGELELGDDVLEIGPGFGATTRVLARACSSLTLLELDERYCAHLREQLGETVGIVHGDATAMPFADGRFSAVVCFTMLHHLPSREAQDRLFAEVARVLRPGGLFAGTDNCGRGLLFRALHVGDILVPVAPDGLAARLRSVGLAEPAIDERSRSFRFRAQKPIDAPA
jgi:SAM-dependent methyltransferase